MAGEVSLPEGTRSIAREAAVDAGESLQDPHFPGLGDYELGVLADRVVDAVAPYIDRAARIDELRKLRARMGDLDYWSSIVDKRIAELEADRG